MKTKIFIFIALIAICVSSIHGQSTEFTYQGRLLDNTLPPTANYDFEFSLFDSLVGGTQFGATQQLLGVAVSNGIFTVRLDFGSQFPGAPRFLQISVKNTPGPFTVLTPRQPFSSAPYAIKSLNATNADTATTANNALNLGGVAASQYVVTTDPRMTDERNPTAGSSNYIQNQDAGPQAASNFNVSGTGTANIFNVSTQYNIGNSRVLGNAGTLNLFAGVGAGNVNTGTNNSFFGARSGIANQTGTANSFFGASSGQSNQTGGDNSFFGTLSGFTTQNGSGDSFFGSRSGYLNETGGNNSFFGANSGSANTTGNNNTIIGFAANVGAGNLDFATAIGSGSLVSTSNTIALGRSSGADKVVIPGLGAGGDTALCRNAGNQVATCSNVGIGTSAPQSRLHVNGTGWFSGDNTPLSAAAGSGVAVGMTGTTGYLFGFDYAAFTPRDLTINLPGGNVGIGVAPSDKLHVGGIIRVDTLGAAGSTQLCSNASNQIATCSSSLKYKTNINRFSLGLSFVKRLNPISYDWKDGGMKDVGFGAEDIAKIDPRFVTFNAAGEVEGVKYDRLSVAFVNAFKEQQTEISELRAVSSEQAEKIKDQNSKIEAQQKQLDALKKLVCLHNPTAEVCKEEK